MTKAKPVYLSLDGKEFLKLRADPDDVRRLFEGLQQGDADEEAVRSFFRGAAADDKSVASVSPSVVGRRLATRLQAENAPEELAAPEEAVEISSRTFENAVANGDFVDPAVDEAPGAVPEETPEAAGRLLSRKSSPSNRVVLSMKSHAWVRSGRSTSPYAEAKEDTDGRAPEMESGDERPVEKDEDERSVRTFHESAIEVVERRGSTSIGFYRRSKGEAEARVETSSTLPNATEGKTAEKGEGHVEGNVGIEAVHPHDGKPLLVEAHRPASGYMRMEAEDDEDKDVEPGIETVEEEGRTVIGIFARRGESLEEESGEEEEEGAGDISLAVDGEEVQTLSLGSNAMAMLVSCAACHACAGGTEGGAEPESGDPSDVEEEASAENGGQKEPELASEELKLDEPAAEEVDSEPEALASEESEASPPQWIDPLRKKSIMCVSESLSEREDLSERKDPVEDEMEGKEDKRDDDNEINPSQQATQKKTAIEEEETEDCSHDGSQEMTLEETMEETQPKKTGSKRMGGARKRLGRYWRSAVGVSTNKRQ